MPVPFVEVGDELNVELADVGDILIWPLIVLELQEFAHISIYRAVECNLGKTDGLYRHNQQCSRDLFFWWLENEQHVHPYIGIRSNPTKTFSSNFEAA